MRPRALRLAALIACLSLAAPKTGAASVIPPTFATLVDSSTDIFVGKVVNRECRWVDMPWGAVIFTFVTFSIEESLKGDARAQTTLRFRGGTVGDVTLNIADMPEFRVDERVVIFVGDRTAVSPLVGFMHGRFRIQRDVTSGIDRVEMHDGRPLVSTAVLGSREARSPIAALGGPEARSPVAARGLSLPNLRSEIVARLRDERRVR
jgi:hypothetical protein